MHEPERAAFMRGAPFRFAIRPQSMAAFLRLQCADKFMEEHICIAGERIGVNRADERRKKD